MKQVVSILMTLTVALVMHAQQSPDVDVSHAQAEFISNDDKPQFAVVGIVVHGDVDTLNVVVHPSAIQSLDGKYRYKPKVVETTRLDSHITIVLELSGKGIPLPDDSVRGVVRLSVRGAGTFRGSRVRFESKRFELFVANAPLSNPVIITNNVQVDPISDNLTGEFKMRGVLVRWPTKESIDEVEDIREIRIDSVYARAVSVDIGPAVGAQRYKSLLSLFPAKLVPGSSNEYEFTFKLVGGRFPLAKGQVKGSAELEIGVVYSHGGITKRRVRKQSIAVSN